MNNQDLFFTNKFVKLPESSSIGNEKIKQFRMSHEEQKRKQDVIPKEYKYLDNTPYGNSSKDIIETKICIDTADRDINKYPLQNDFKFFLGKTFKNVQKIELISTSIPNTDTAIKDLPVQLKNNTITWVNEEDTDLGIFENVPINFIVANTVDITVSGHQLTVGTIKNILIFNSKLQSDLVVTGFLDGKKQATVIDSNTLRILWNGGIPDTGTVSVNIGLPTYTITLVPGNYSAFTIIKQMTLQFNLIKRRNGNGQFHYFNISLDIDTNVITLESVITKLLSPNPISTIAGSTIITVSALGHGFKTGDIVLMIGTLTTASINGNTLAGDFYITVLDSNTFTYEVNVPAVATIAGGGNNVRTGKQAPYKILFDTADTLIQFNIGFSDEDSSEYIGFENPITTKTIKIVDAEITSSDIITITTDIPHTLNAASIINITSITTSVLVDGLHRIELTVATPHLIDLPIRITARSTNCYPDIDGEFIAYPTSPTKFFVYNKFVNIAGTSGKIVNGDDLIQIVGIYTTPTMAQVPFFYIDNVVTSTKFDINFSALHINSITAESQVNTNHLYIKDISHGFNNLSSIIGYNSTFSILRTQLHTNVFGFRVTGVAITDGPILSNAVDLAISNHGLSTSDVIRITNSTSTPSTNGTYTVQVMSNDSVRINVVHVTFVVGTCDVVHGEFITLTNTNSLPKIDGTYRVINKVNITNITTGVTETTITVSQPTIGWLVGDTITISGTNTTPILVGTFTISTVINSTNFKVTLTEQILASGTTGSVVNNSTYLVQTDKTIITPGTKGIIGNDQDVIMYRIESDDLNGYTLGGIKINDINNTRFTINRIIDTDTYLVKIVGAYATKTITSGGSNVYISTKNKGFKSMISNTVDSTINTKLARSINLAGEYYMYFTSPGITDKGTSPRIISSSTAVSEIFAQLLLSESPGLMIYNSFVTAPFIFNPILSSIEYMHFKTVTKGGFPFNYNNIDFGFTLQITEVVDNLDNSFVSSRTGNNAAGNIQIKSKTVSERITPISRGLSIPTKQPDLWSIRAGDVKKH